MATALETNHTIIADAAPRPVEKKPQGGFDIALPDGLPSHFESAEAVKAAVLSGAVPRMAHMRVVGGPAGGAPVTVERWAGSDARLRSLYAPVWALSLKGALVGFVVVGVLKCLDTLALIGSVNPGAAFLWLLIGAAMFSPKWKLQLMAASVCLSFNMGANFMALWGAWFGVAVFAAVFGVSSGMVVGTIVGLVKAPRARVAPDALPEGRKPVVCGIVIPFAVLAAAAVAYVQVLMPAALKLLEK